MSLADYGRVDFGAEGAVARDLFNGLATEGRQLIVPLTSPAGASIETPPLLTPHMTGWYQSHVAPIRGTALTLVRTDFETETLPNGNHGFLREAEIDRIEGQKLVQIRDERATFYQQQEVRELGRELDRLTTEYERKRATYGRDAIEWRPVPYFAVLGLLALFLEGLVNFESFLVVPGWSPAIATGAFLAVALSFGASAHLLGLVMKQWSERFGGNVTTRTRSDSQRILGISFLLALFGFGLVAYARFFYFKDLIDRESFLGNADLGFSIIGRIGGALFGNVIAYMLGLAWAYVRHDAVPGFAEERRVLRMLQARQLKFFQKQLEPRVLQRRLQAAKDLEFIERRDADQSQNLHRYAALRQQFDVLRAVDARVLALLVEYRNRLSAQTREEGLRTRFLYDDPTAAGVSTRIEIEPEAYLGQNLRLPYA